MLVGIEGKDLGPKFFLGIDLGVLEGQFGGGSFSDSIFDPSVIGAHKRPISGESSEKVEEESTSITKRKIKARRKKTFGLTIKTIKVKKR